MYFFPEQSLKKGLSVMEIVLLEVKTPRWRSPQKRLRRENDKDVRTCGFLANIPADPRLNHYLLLWDKSPWMRECYKGSCIGQPWNRISFKFSRAYTSVQLNVTFLLLSLIPSILSSPKETAVISTLSKTDRLSADKWKKHWIVFFLLCI